MIGLEHTDVAGRHRADQSVVLCQERVVFRIQIRSKVGRKSLDFDVIRIVSILTERDLAEVLAVGGIIFVECIHGIVIPRRIEEIVFAHLTLDVVEFILLLHA